MIPSRIGDRLRPPALRALAGRFLAVAILFAAGAVHAQEPVTATRADFLGAWAARSFDPVIYATTAEAARKGLVLHQKMLLFVEPVEDTDYLVRCRFFEWNEDYSTVLGPSYGVGAFDPATGKLVLGGPAQGLNPVTLLPGPSLQYVHAKAMQDNSWMSVRFLWPIDKEAAGDLEATLVEKQQ